MFSGPGMRTPQCLDSHMAAPEKEEDSLKKLGYSSRSLYILEPSDGHCSCGALTRCPRFDTCQDPHMLVNMDARRARGAEKMVRHR